MKTLVLHDAHVPFQSRRWDRKVREFVASEQPRQIILAGDIADFHALSQHRRNPKWEDNFDKEVNGLVRWLTRLRDSAPKAEIRYIEGNHEARWNTYVQGRAPVLRLIGIDWDKYIGLGDLGIKKTRAGYKIPCGQGQRVAIYHGHEGRLGLSRIPGATALKFAHEHGCNVHIGHTHRLGMLCSRVGGRAYFGVEGGYGGDLRKPAFDFINQRKPPWTLGFTVYDSSQTLSPYPTFVRV